MKLIYLVLMVKKIILDLTIGAVVLAGAINGDLLEYGLSMARGQLNIVINSRPVDDYLSDPSVPDSLKKKVLLIQDIRKYTVDELGLLPSDNYTTIYDQQGKPLMWVVTACERYSLRPKLWKFPVIGKVSYKGFFRKEKAEAEERILQAQGYETKIRIVNAWSTLGWFRDPIMTSMLSDPPGEIANLIIHELSHGTIFVKNDVEYSENLANFIGDQGSFMFLKSRYGENSQEYLQFRDDNEDYNLYAAHFVKGSRRLDSLYQSGSFALLPDARKDSLKNALIADIIAALDHQPFHRPENFGGRFKGKLPNNAFFIVFLQYNNQQDEFAREFAAIANNDLRKYVGYLRDKFPK